VPSGIAQTFVLSGKLALGTGTVTAFGELTAIATPFGSSGGSILSTQSVDAVGPGAAE